MEDERVGAFLEGLSASSGVEATVNERNRVAKACFEGMRRASVDLKEESKRGGRRAKTRRMQGHAAVV